MDYDWEDTTNGKQYIKNQPIDKVSCSLGDVVIKILQDYTGITRCTVGSQSPWAIMMRVHFREALLCFGLLMQFYWEQFIPRITTTYRYKRDHVWRDVG